MPYLGTVPTARDLEAQRQQGLSDIQRFVEEHAPSDPILRVAWALGFSQVDQVRAAVAVARKAGVTWSRIAEVTGDKDRRVAEMKYGAGYERQRRYRARHAPSAEDEGA